jgi:hypothetical protein
MTQEQMAAVLVAMHALIQKDPFPEPSRILEQALEYGKTFAELVKK